GAIGSWRYAAFVSLGILVGFALGVPVSLVYDLPFSASLLVGAGVAVVFGIISVALGTVRAWRVEVIAVEVGLLGGLLVTLAAYFVLFALHDQPKPPWVRLLVPFGPPWLNIPMWGVVLFLPGWLWRRLRARSPWGDSDSQSGVVA